MVDGIQELVNVLQKTDVEDPSKTYSAEVSSIDNEGRIWVYLEGSTKETPTAMTSAEVNVGDFVNVEWRNNKLFIAGNTSNPSAGIVRVAAVEQAAQVANQAAANAVADAGIARSAAESAQADASIASEQALIAKQKADSVEGIAQAAQQSASDAQTAASSAQESATQAISDAASASEAASTAQAAANAAQGTANTAQASANQAIADAGRAQSAADTADENARAAQQSASSAQTAAGIAQTSAEQAVVDAESASIAAADAGRAASLAQSAAEAAQHDIDEQQDYFYHDSQGAHIVSGSNSNYRTDVASDGMSITEIATSKVVAFFRAAGATIGKALSNRFEVKSNKLEAYDSNNNKYFEVSSSGMMFGAFQAASTDDVDEVEVKVNTAINTADTAKTSANEALATANTASTNANNALSTANTAETKAQSVVDRADAGEFKGDAGPTGPQGPQGPAGEDGQDGADGKSAYESAQDGGYSGTESQFNSDLAAVPETIAHFYFDNEGAHVLGDTYRTDVKDGLKVVKNSDGTELANFGVGGATIKSGNGTQIAHFGYGETQGESGMLNAPYYDLGVRKQNTTRGQLSVVEGSNTEASGFTSHTEGYQTVASDDYSHAEGGYTTASGDASHAEGYNTTASKSCSHAEGFGTTASGYYSHAEGFQTTASGIYSHAEGWNTTANGGHQHVQGKYNVADSSYADIVGNGSDIDHRSNAYALDWEGNGHFAGDVYVGCNADSSGGTKLAKLSDIRSQFVVETYSEHSSKSVGTSGASATYNISKEGYYPLGVVGFYVSNANVLVRACYLNNVANGSATINYYMRSVSGTNTVTQTTRVLWVKI